MSRNQPERPFDGIDLAMMIGIAISQSVPPLAFGLVALGVGQFIVRRSPRAANYLLRAAGWEDVSLPHWILPAAPQILPAPKAATADEAWLSPPPGTGAPRQAPLSEILAALPRTVTLQMMRPAPTSSTAVPIGIPAKGQPLWLDFAGDILHMGLYGTSGAGKDTWLRAMFYVLTRRNTPEMVQFVFLDAKGDWMLPRLKGRAHMWHDPYGADPFDDARANAGEQIRSGIEAVQMEMRRRLKLVNGGNCRTREEYLARNPKAIMPMLVVVFTDVGGDVEGPVEQLLIDLVSKARAVGIRAIVSMQTPTGASMKWRSNLSTNISGMIPDTSQDGPALGLRDKSSVLYAPSSLPSPKQRPGVMVVRQGNEQHLVQGVYIDENRFDAYVDTLPRRVSLPVSQVEMADYAASGETGRETAPRETGNAAGNEGFDEAAFLNELVVRDQRQRKEALARLQFRQGATVEGCNELLKTVYGAGLKTTRLTELRREALAGVVQTGASQPERAIIGVRP